MSATLAPETTQTVEPAAPAEDAIRYFEDLAGNLDAHFPEPVQDEGTQETPVPAYDEPHPNEQEEVHFKRGWMERARERWDHMKLRTRMAIGGTALVAAVVAPIAVEEVVIPDDAPKDVRTEQVASEPVYEAASVSDSEGDFGEGYADVQRRLEAEHAARVEFTVEDPVTHRQREVYRMNNDMTPHDKAIAALNNAGIGARRRFDSLLAERVAPDAMATIDTLEAQFEGQLEFSKVSDYTETVENGRHTLKGMVNIDSEHPLPIQTLRPIERDQHGTFAATIILSETPRGTLRLESLQLDPATKDVSEQASS